MDKLLVEVRVPAADSKFDALIPPLCKGGEVLKIVKEIFTTMFEGKFREVDDSILCNYSTGKIVDINQSMIEQGIKNGTIFILI